MFSNRNVATLGGFTTATWGLLRHTAWWERWTLGAALVLLRVPRLEHWVSGHVLAGRVAA